MISPVNNFIKDFADAGADIITFHPEATDNLFVYLCYCLTQSATAVE